MNDNYFPPEFGNDAFHCPYCNVYARQLYAHIASYDGFPLPSKCYGAGLYRGAISSKWAVTVCQRCDEEAFWNDEKLIYPIKLSVAPPNGDLPKEIKDDYLEAAHVLNDSPRAAAALLRLALQKLCKELGEKGENINDDIKNLVRKGLNSLVQKSLDALRITGNNAVHPGEINLIEEPERVVKLFALINFIAAKMISEPAEINSFYSQLPPGSLEAIEKRDKK